MISAKTKSFDVTVGTSGVVSMTCTGSYTLVRFGGGSSETISILQSCIHVIESMKLLNGKVFLRELGVGIRSGPIGEIY